VKEMSIKNKLYHYKAKVKRVVDGDTVVFSEIDLGFEIALKNRKARLLGVDTAELRSSNEDEKVKAFEAKDYMIDRLEGKDVVIKIREYEYVDNFGRILADVYLEEELINETLLAEGLAVVFED
jgi:micrococcal nuclease